MDFYQRFSSALLRNKPIYIYDASCSNDLNAKSPADGLFEDVLNTIACIKTLNANLNMNTHSTQFYDLSLSDFLDYEMGIVLFSMEAWLTCVL